MRVLQVLSTLNIGSGIANFVMNYYRKIVSEDVQFDFLLFCPVEKDYCDEVRKLGGRIFFIERPTLQFSKYNNRLKEFFKAHSGEWDIVHINEILVQRFIIKNSLKYGKVKKIVTHSHASKFVLPKYGVSKVKNKFLMLVKTLRNKILLKNIGKKSNCCLGCSNQAGEALYGKRYWNSGKNQFYVIKNAINIEPYIMNDMIRDQYREELGIENKRVIILVGRLCIEKNQIFMLHVMKELCKLDDSYVLLLVGEGNLRKTIEEQITQMNLSRNVILLGNRTDAAKLYQCSDIFVLPSVAEGLGVVLIEAQASGLPCITSTGVPKEVKITPYVQFLSLKEGAASWADAILNTFLQRYDAKEYLKKSGYDIEFSANNLIQIYRNLLK